MVGWSVTRPDELLAGSAEARRPLDGAGLFELAIDPFAMFETAAATTGGALVKRGSDLDEALTSVRGRFVVSYQTDAVAPGWHDVRVEVATMGWRVRHAPRVLVPALAVPRTAPPIELAVEMAPVRGAAAQPGRETITLPVVVDLEPLRGRFAEGREVRLAFRVFATLPSGRTVARAIDVVLPRLPREGALRYETSLVVPAGTSAFAVEVREASTGAIGAAGPVDAPAGGPSGAAASGAAAAPDEAHAPFTESSEVRIGEALFLAPEGTAGAPEAVRVLWKDAEQRIVRVAGGAGSPLELGIVIDVSESVAAERAAFARAATEAAARLLGPGDRVFRVDFGTLPRFLGAAQGGPGDLFAAASAGPPERTAIFDALRFALDRFEGTADRAALIVFTDGCETAGRTDWREVARVARSTARPLFVVMATGRFCEVKVDAPPPSLSMVGTARLNIQTDAAIKPDSRSRASLVTLANETGGLVFRVKNLAEVATAWSEIEAALARLWVAVFETSDPALDSREVEVRSAGGRLLRPSG